MSANVLIIDSGMRNLGGHNFSYTRAVQSALEKRGFSVTVLANKNLAADVATEFGYEPTFSFGTYDYPPGMGYIEILHTSMPRASSTVMSWNRCSNRLQRSTP